MLKTPIETSFVLLTMPAFPGNAILCLEYVTIYCKSEFGSVQHICQGLPETIQTDLGQGKIHQRNCTTTTDTITISKCFLLQ